ncbi:uncharacterized protein BXZ73DRAFT_89921 [Epithele typhae]|uniref:uncharacterized protein n=1 Tax=Epithele typhae TaxID=378194 RepID=UPI002008510B|nr:uncharacterized protein BXZ73DRAFT_89921 [Epithele typhae]KAH9932776.1 hypothetical protein BXZ73DRAFT_89921 [Epithele typhae]
MANDRKSTVSSFYGSRRSNDVLSSDFPPPAGQQRARVESTNSFYGPNRNSRADMYDAATAGYNQHSYPDQGRTEPVKGGDEEAAWDVYADFNNAGPRYSAAFGMGDNGYRQVPSPTPYSPQTSAYGKQSAASLSGAHGAAGNVEMVTWKAEELRGMSKKAKREEKLDKAATKWKAWNRGESGLCGSHFTRRFTAWFIFGLIAVYHRSHPGIHHPRVPSFSTNVSQPLSPATSDYNKTVTTEFSRSPANFSFPGLMKLQLDTGDNFLPLHFSNIHGSLYDLETSVQVASGDTGSLTLPAKSLPVIGLNLNFTYSAVNDSDTTWNNWYAACKNKAIYTDNKRPAVQFRLILDMKISGLIGTHSTSTQVTEADCPIQLPLNSV